MRVITFTWNPDPALMGARVNTVASSLENRLPPLAAAGAEMQASIRERFETETDPSGEPWVEWSEVYTPFAVAYPNEGILTQSGALKEAATASEAIVINHDTVFYSTPSLPHYGLAHEAGVSDRGKGGTLPQRSFLGMSDQAILKVFGYFTRWFDGSLDLFVTRRGRVGGRHAFRAIPGGFFIRA